MSKKKFTVLVRWEKEYQRWEAQCEGLEGLGSGRSAGEALQALGMDIARQARQIDGHIAWYEEGRPNRVKQLKKERRVLRRMGEEFGEP